MKGINRQRILKWDLDGRNKSPGQGTILFIRIVSIIHIVRIEYHFDIQEHDFMSRNKFKLKPKHICSSMHSGWFRILYQLDVHARHHASD
jgi:hypothetical protein